jgi:uncharacterized protein (TIGR00266 family)
MKIALYGEPSFSHVTVDLEPGEEITAESGAMQSMSAELDLKAVTNGSFFSALAKRLLGGESFFVNRFTNNSDKTRHLTIAQDVPGQIVALELEDGQEVTLQRGAYLAHVGQVELKASWAGFVSWIAGEGLVHLKARSTGKGTLFFGAYGAILERSVVGELKVDDGHLVAYDPNLKLKLAMSGGLFSTLFGGEGLVTRVVGEGVVYIQTRSVKGLAAWLNPKFR